MRLIRAVKKSEIANPQKPLKFNFIALSNTFFLMPKVKCGKETVKFLAIFDHVSMCASYSPFSVPARDLSELAPVRSCHCLKRTALNNFSVHNIRRIMEHVTSATTMPIHPKPRAEV